MRDRAGVQNAIADLKAKGAGGAPRSERRGTHLGRGSYPFSKPLPGKGEYGGEKVWGEEKPGGKRRLPERRGGLSPQGEQTRQEGGVAKSGARHRLEKGGELAAKPSRKVEIGETFLNTPSWEKKERGERKRRPKERQGERSKKFGNLGRRTPHPNDPSDHYTRRKN